MPERGNPSFRVCGGTAWSRWRPQPWTHSSNGSEYRRLPKIDVEGAEPSVLAGLGNPLAALSFEYLPDALDYARICVSRLAELGIYRYNWSPGETYRLASDRWMNSVELFAALETVDAQRQSGDIYARLDLSAS